MKIIISPAKKMKIIDDVVIQCTTPLFLLKTTKLLHHLQCLDYEELKSYLKCSDTITKTTFEQFQIMSLDKNCTPAGSLTLTNSQNRQKSFKYGFFYVKFLFFDVVCVVYL